MQKFQQKLTAEREDQEREWDAIDAVGDDNSEVSPKKSEKQKSRAAAILAACQQMEELDTDTADTKTFMEKFGNIVELVSDESGSQSEYVSIKAALLDASHEARLFKTN